MICALDLAVIIRDAAIQPRETMASGLIKDYAVLYREGHELPPIVVFQDGIDYWLADGFHRVIAAQEAGLTALPAEVQVGTKREAILYACSSNTHGKARTPEDKRRVVTRLLQDVEWKTWPLIHIARHCGVSEGLVHKIRRALSSHGEKIDRPAVRTVERNGTSYTMDTSAIGPHPSPPAHPADPLRGCRVCGQYVAGSYWHCISCGDHWSLTRSPCGTCGQERPFDYFPLPDPAMLLRDPESIPWCVTIMPAANAATADASYDEDEVAAEAPHEDITRDDIEAAFPSRPIIPKLILIPDPPPVVNGQRPVFNRTTEMVDWAKWTWNPVTGCLHNCIYCYARDIAERFYPEKFVPTFRPQRLKAPQYTKVPAEANEQIGYRNVFVCSMADLFGKWVQQEWIDAVLDEVRAAPQWNFLFLTKFPQRLADIAWPENAWVGTTVDEQYRVEIAEKAFRKVDASVKWLSCEPLRERLTFTSLDMFDWVVLGGQSKSSQAPAFQPPWEWVEHLWTQARASGCMIYWKPNLETRPQEYPGQVVVS